MEKKYNGLRNGAIVYGVIAIAFIGCKIAFLPAFSWWGVALALVLPIAIVIGFLWAVIAL